MTCLDVPRNSNESEMCYEKRRSYVRQHVLRKIKQNDAAVPTKLKYASPLTVDDQNIKDDIEDYWSDILGKHVDMINMSYFDIYNAVEANKANLKFFIPDSFFFGFINEWLTQPSRSTQVDDKQLYKYLFSGVKTTEVVGRKIGDNYFDDDFNKIGIDDFFKLCHAQPEVVVKASISSYGGKRVMFWNPIDHSDEELFSYISNPPYFYTQSNGTEYVIEKVIEQHPVLSSLNPTSVNTIRVITLIWDGKSIPISSVVRVGVNGMRLDNLSSGGFAIGIYNDTGKLKDVAYDINGRKISVHPQTGSFAGIQIPSWSNILKVVEKLSWRFSGISKLISWDIAVDKLGEPVVVETTLSSGGIDLHQYCNGPLFGSLTDEVLRRFKTESHTFNAFIGKIGLP